jgi:hypothetical protein
MGNYLQCNLCDASGHGTAVITFGTLYGYKGTTRRGWTSVFIKVHEEIARSDVMDVSDACSSQ